MELVAKAQDVGASSTVVRTFGVLIQFTPVNHIAIENRWFVTKVANMNNVTYLHDVRVVADRKGLKFRSGIATII